MNESLVANEHLDDAGGGGYAEDHSFEEDGKRLQNAERERRNILLLDYRGKTLAEKGHPALSRYFWTSAFFAANADEKVACRQLLKKAMWTEGPRGKVTGVYEVASSPFYIAVREQIGDNDLVTIWDVSVELLAFPLGSFSLLREQKIYSLKYAYEKYDCLVRMEATTTRRRKVGVGHEVVMGFFTLRRTTTDCSGDVTWTFYESEDVEPLQDQKVLRESTQFVIHESGLSGIKSNKIGLLIIRPRRESGIYVMREILTTFTEMNQLLSFPFSMNHQPFDNSVVGSLPSFLKGFQLNFGPGDRAFNVSLFAVFVIFAFVFNVCSLHYLATSSDRRTISPSISVLLWAGSSILVIPTVFVLSLGIACTHQDDGTFTMDGFPDIACYGSTYYGLVATSGLLLFVYVMVVFAAVPLEGDFGLWSKKNPIPQDFHVLSKKQMTFDYFLICFKIIMTLMISFLGDADKISYTKFLIVFSVILSGLSLCLSQRFPSFFRPNGNRIRFSYNVAILFTNVVALAIIFSDDRWKFGLSMTFAVGFIPVIGIGLLIYDTVSPVLALLGSGLLMVVQTAAVITLVLFPIEIVWGSMCVFTGKKDLCFYSEELGLFGILVGVAGGCIVVTFAFYLFYSRQNAAGESRREHMGHWQLLYYTLGNFLFVSLPVFFGVTCIQTGEFCIDNNRGSGDGLVMVGVVFFAGSTFGYFICCHYSFKKIRFLNVHGVIQFGFTWLAGLIVNVVFVSTAWAFHCVLSGRSSMMCFSETENILWIVVMLLCTIIILYFLATFCRAQYVRIDVVPSEEQGSDGGTDVVVAERNRVQFNL